jgi:predicted esterase YcpF (UPF0227 family)
MGRKIFYLHGFRSTPQSAKARQLRDHLAAHRPDLDFICPALPVSPQRAMQLIEFELESIARSEVTLIGSSLGGFYATSLVERFGFRAVLLNPAIKPQRDLKSYLGEQTVYGSDQTVWVREEFLDELEALDVPKIADASRYFLLAAKGDELIDWRDMVAKYQGAATHLIDGSDHGISDFADYIELVLDFADAGQ